MFFLKRNRALFDRIRSYFGLLGESMDYFNEAISRYLKKEADEHFEVLVRKMHRDESGADDLRRGIEIDIFEKSLLPEIQGDILTILDKIDRIASKAESVLYMLQLQKTPLIRPIKKDMAELVILSIETFRNTLAAAENFLGDMEKVRDFARIIDNNESIGDRLERKMIKTIFEEKMDVGEKILQKEIVIQVGSICDLCEDAMDSIVISAIKRHI